MNGLIMGGRGGTFEKITLRDTILGILALPALMVAINLLMLVTFTAAIILIGQIAGPAIVIGVALYALARPYDTQARGKLWCALGVGVLLVAVDHIFQAWPRIIGWLYFPSDGFLVSWFGNPFVRANDWLVVMRLTIAIILPATLWLPYRWTMWALMAELLMPKYRETPFDRADVASFPQPDGVRLRGRSRIEQEVPRDAHIPSVAGLAEGPEIVGE